MKQHAIIMILFTLVLSTAPASTLYADEFGEVPVEHWDIAAPAGHESVGAVVVFDSGYAKWEAKRLRFTRHQRIKVLSDSAAQLAGQMMVELADYDYLGKFRARVHHDPNTSQTYKKKTASEKTYGDVKVATMKLNEVEAGDIVDWYYEIEYYGGYDRLGPIKLLYFAMKDKGLSAGASGKIQELMDREYDRYLEQEMRNLPTWYFDGPFYTLESCLKVDLMTRVNYSYYPANLPTGAEDPEYDEDWLSGYKYYTWTVRDLPPGSAASSHVTAGADRAAIYFTMLTTQHGAGIEQQEFANDYWANIGYGLKAYLQEYCEDHGSCHKYAKRLIRGTVDDHSRIDSIYSYVVTEYKPEHPLVELRPQQWDVDDLFKKKHGAAFEINILLLEMLRAAEIQAWPLFISTKGKASFRDVGHFNHMIVLADAGGDAVFLDACLDDCSAGSLPIFSDVDEGLLIEEEGLTFCTVVAGECTSKSPHYEVNVP